MFRYKAMTRAMSISRWFAAEQTLLKQLSGASNVLI
jgi:hypothetical protein